MPTDGRVIGFSLNWSRVGLGYIVLPVFAKRIRSPFTIGLPLGSRTLFVSLSIKKRYYNNDDHLDIYTHIDKYEYKDDWPNEKNKQLSKIKVS